MKKWFKKLMKNKKVVWLIGSLGFLLFGLVAFIVGAYLVGWNVFGWLVSESSILFYAGVLLYLLGVVWYYFKKRIGSGYDE